MSARSRLWISVLRDGIACGSRTRSRSLSVPAAMCCFTANPGALNLERPEPEP